jgi:hypothetical protein
LYAGFLPVQLPYKLSRLLIALDDQRTKKRPLIAAVYELG